jgi:hypothetical protein
MGLGEFTGTRACVLFFAFAMTLSFAFALCARLSALVAAPEATEAYAQAAELEPDNASHHAVRCCVQKLASA